MGNVWCWCLDWFNGLDGFKVSRIYDDFSTPCFDNKHAMLLGGSFVSSGNESSVWARFSFRPHFFQQAGFRVIIGEGGNGVRPPTSDQKACRERKIVEETNIYEQEKVLNEYLNMHYASAAEVIPFSFAPNATQFPQQCADFVFEVCKKYNVPTNRVLDLGCAVGRASFELSAQFTNVLGIDLSETFVKTATMLKETGSVEYTRKDEGELNTMLSAVVGAHLDRNRVAFKVGDAACLPPDIGRFNAVLTANLLCRLPSPKACLGRMGGVKGIVEPGGVLINLSPNSWLEEFTPPGAWLGGFVDNGKNVTSFDGLKQALGDEFEFLEERDVPLLIREHARKYQFIVSHATAWRRKA
jgi:putative 4-mercaptohistidine N1-methyltranferase